MQYEIAFVLKAFGVWIGIDLCEVGRVKKVIDGERVKRVDGHFFVKYGDEE